MSLLGKRLAELDAGGVIASLRERQEELAAENAAQRDDAIERELAIADYYRTHPTFRSIVQSMRHSFPLKDIREIMQAARRAEDARPKPGASQAPSLSVVKLEPESDSNSDDASSRTDHG